MLISRGLMQQRGTDLQVDRAWSCQLWVGRAPVRSRLSLEPKSRPAVHGQGGERLLLVLVH